VPAKIIQCVINTQQAERAAVVIQIDGGIGVSECELRFSFDRSPGPGGQNVNKVNTRVTLQFDVERSMSLTASQRTRVRQALASRIGQDGVLRIVSSKERTQLGNRRAAVNRFIELLGGAFHTPKPRRKTSPPASVNRERLQNKARRSNLKRSRGAGVTLGGD
jgi:ribosome-associated protein